MSTIIVLVVVIFIFLVVSLVLQKQLKQSTASPRKILHIGAISVCALSVYIVEDLDAVFWATILAIPFIGIAVFAGVFRDPVKGRKSWGMVYFALVFAFLLYLSADKPQFVFYPMAIMAWADGLATLIGERIGKRRYRLEGDERSVEGSVTFFVVALLLLFFGHLAVGEEAPSAVYGPGMLVFIAFFLTLTEATSTAGRDNIWVPLSAYYWLICGAAVPGGAAAIMLIISILAFLSYLAFRKKWLNAGGAVSACLMGFILLFSPEPMFVIPALTFFLIGTGFSLLPKGGKPIGEGEKPSRSKSQVLANGGMPVVFLMLYFFTGHFSFVLGFIAGFAAALSDTASSEIGTRMSGRSYAIFGFRPLEAGVSGGVSVAGSLAGIAFAIAIPMVSVAFGWIDYKQAMVIAAIAFSANILDSLLGQFAQSKHYTDGGGWRDSEGSAGGNISGGLRWMSNDRVNAIATAFATVVATCWHVLKYIF